MFKRFISYYGPEKGLFIADTVCALTYAGIDLAFPVILRALTGGLFTEGAAAIMDGLMFVGAGLVLMYLIRTACIYFVSAQGHIMGARMESRMREDLFDQYERFSFSYFDAHNSGDMMSRVVNDRFDICEGAHHLPEWIIICGIKIIGALAILFTISPELAGALTLVTVVFVFDICEGAHHLPEWIIICGIKIIGALAILFTISPELAGALTLVTVVFVGVMIRQCGIKIIGALAILFTISPELAGALTLVTVVFVGVMIRQNLHMRSVFADNRTKISEVNSQLQDSLAGMRVVKSFANEDFVGVMIRQNLHMRSVFADNRTKISEVNSQLQDSLAGMRVVKSFANEDAERAKFRVANGRYLDSKVAQYRVMGGYQATSAVMTAAHYITIVLLGGYLVAQGRMTAVDMALLGGYLVAQGRMTAVDMATFALYISLFTGPIETLVNSTEMFQKAIAGFRRMDEVLATAPDIQDAPGALPLQVTEGAIEYRDVCFSYADGEIAENGEGQRPVIDHMSLSIKPGETIALVGPSGGGKSTTCSLLPRFYDVTSGSILIDGQDVRAVTQHSLRSAIGLVQQDVYLFDGTLRDNIGYGRPGATDAEIEDAARKANIHEFIANLPQGYDTVVGTACGARSAWCSRTCICSTARCATTSATAAPAPPTPRSRTPRARRTSMSSSRTCRKGTTPWWASAAVVFPVARSSASPSRACSSRTRRS